MSEIKQFMEIALEEAKLSLPGDIPVGCIIVHKGAIIGRGHNTREQDRNIFGHAEMNAIYEAQKYLGDWRLDSCEMYVTLEPCAMCSGAIRHSRIKKVFYAAGDSQEGGMGGKWNIPGSSTTIFPFIMKEESEQLIGGFFESLRNSKEVSHGNQKN